jgi:hypothetical protein
VAHGFFPAIKDIHLVEDPFTACQGILVETGNQMSWDDILKMVGALVRQSGGDLSNARTVDIYDCCPSTFSDFQKARGDPLAVQGWKMQRLRNHPFFGRSFDENGVVVDP